MAGKNRLMARLVATSATVTPDSDYIATNLTKTQPQAVGLSVYSSIDSLPTSAATGTKAFVTSNNTLYFYNSGWYKIAIINSFNPQWITEPNSEYTLDLGNIDSDLIITVLASDSDDVPITYTVVTDSDFNVAATITHDSDKDNRWVISRVDSESGAGTTGGVIFKASDGINLVQKSVNFLIGGLGGGVVDISPAEISALAGWSSPTQNDSNAYTYNSGNYTWTKTGYITTFEILRIILDMSDYADANEWNIRFTGGGFGTIFDNRSYHIVHGINGTLDARYPSGYYAQNRSDTGGWDYGSSLSLTSLGGSYSSLSTQINYVKATGTWTYYMARNNGSTWTQAYQHTAFGAGNAIDSLEIIILKRTGTGLSIYPAAPAIIP